jgi:hypothetical protein
MWQGTKILTKFTWMNLEEFPPALVKSSETVRTGTANSLLASSWRAWDRSTLPRHAQIPSPHNCVRWVPFSFKMLNLQIICYTAIG